MIASCGGHLSGTCNNIRCHAARANPQSILSACSSHSRLPGVPVRRPDGHMTMLCYPMLCYAMLCYAMLCYAMLCYAMLCYAMLCYAMPWYAMPCHAMPCHAMPCCAVLCYAVLCCAVLHATCYAMQGLLQQISRRHDARRGESNLDSRAPLDSSNARPRALQLHPGYGAAQWIVSGKVGVQGGCWPLGCCLHELW